jgi:predicted ATPase
MLRELQIKNFKSWADSGIIRIAPLTIFCGNNSSGKSSISQFLLMLKQTVESYDRQRVLHLGEKGSLVDLGTFKDMVFKHNEENKVEFSLTFDTSNLKIIDATTPNSTNTYSKLKFEALLSYEKRNSRTIVENFRYTALNGEEKSFGLSLRQGKYDLTAENYSLKRQQGRAWKLPPPENFFGFPDEAVAYYQNTSFLNDLSLAIKIFFKSICYVGPLRDNPERSYNFSGEIPPDVGVKGTIAINALLAAKGRKLQKGFKYPNESFENLIARWLKDMGLIFEFKVEPIGEGRKEHEVKVKIHKDSPEVLITDVGFGISQILPVLVQCFYVAPKSTIIFEQPEIHLHPSVQSHLGDLFIETTKSRENGKDRDIQVIIESHSEHLIRRIQRRIAEETISPEDVAIYFIHQEKGQAKLQELQINLFGDVTNWPDDFFGNDIDDLAAMTKAARERKNKQKQ